jgi:hypothetical protein
MFKRILFTALLGGAMLFTVLPTGAEANGRHADNAVSRDRHDYGSAWGGRYGDYYGFLHFRGAEKAPDLYYYPVGYEAPGAWRAGLYGPGYYAPALTDVFGDDYYFTYGYRCNGYRNGFYYNGFGQPYSYYGAPRYRRNADCEDFFVRHGYWYGTSDCSRFDVEQGYCDND